MHTLPTSVYVHVPFCQHRCGYCDFTLIAGRDDLVPRYLAGLAKELPPSHGVILKTLFLGGGTPTHPQPAELAQLFELLRSRFAWNLTTEVTVEANPLDLNESRLEVLKNAGVNRLSLGVQAFDDQSLVILERNHAANDLAGIIHRSQGVIPNVSVDLIFGVPGQTLPQWQESLARAVEMGVTHLSTYGLTFEHGTAFWNRLSRGELSRTPEDLEREMYAFAMEWLPAQGYMQYEISSFARPGYQCQHNHVYWSGDPYLAYGPGASRYVDGRRETNIRSVLGWLDRMEQGESPVAERETLDARARGHELLYVGLRRCAGVERYDFQQRTGIALDDLVGPALAKLVQQGLLVDDGKRVSLTMEGRFLADMVASELL